jgi:hypothetical protein
MSATILVLGAGLVAHAAVMPVLAQLARMRRLAVRVFDRAVLTPGHLRCTDVYEGTPGQPKADALAQRLRAAGVVAAAHDGNLTRWPLDLLRGDLAFVGLDDESARGAAHRLLRAAGTPASLFLGITDDVGVHVLGSGGTDACYDCLRQGTVPPGPTPCRPQGHGVSTRAASTARARAVLAERLPALALAALRGEGLGTFHSFPGEGPASRARFARAPECLGCHDDPGVPAMVRLRPGATLGEALAAAAVAVGGPARLSGCALRLDYFCPACGRTGQRGADLVRAWPARERCGCGSAEVRPLCTLTAIDGDEALGLGLAGVALADLGVPPGGELFAARADAPAGTRPARLVLPASGRAGSDGSVSIEVER